LQSLFKHFVMNSEGMKKSKRKKKNKDITVS
jgi:hypothetical protein